MRTALGCVKPGEFGQYGACGQDIGGRKGNAPDQTHGGVKDTILLLPEVMKSLVRPEIGEQRHKMLDAIARWQATRHRIYPSFILAAYPLHQLHPVSHRWNQIGPYKRGELDRRRL